MNETIRRIKNKVLVFWNDKYGQTLSETNQKREKFQVNETTNEKGDTTTDQQNSEYY